MPQNNTDKKRFRIILSGRVQGVFFRQETGNMAEKLGITGFARNMPDGTVNIVAEGEKENMEQFKEWCHHGPDIAGVEKAEVSEENATGEFDTFKILY